MWEREDERISARYNGKKLVLTLFVLLFAVAPPRISGQVKSQSSTRDTMIEEIKSYASRHVKSGSPMDTKLVVEMYRDNAVGLRANEIAQIYEEQYLKLKSASEPGPWEQVLPKVGWVTALILSILLIFRDTLKEWATKLVKVAGNRVYDLLAGKRLFYFIALKRYRKSLIEKYRELHIPFRPNRPLLMREVYVPLKVAGSSDDKLIDAYHALAGYRKLMVNGPPGSGKSMLLKHIVLSYAEGRLTHLPDRPIPILLELHRLNDPSLTLEQHLVEELARNGFPHANILVRRGLKQGSLMLLLDGLDEVNASRRGQVVQQIKDLLDKHRDCRFMGTCRTAIYHDEFADAVDQTMEVMEFKDQQIRHFLRSWSSSMSPDKSIEQLIQTLGDRPRIMALARNPLLLTIIAYLYTDTNFVLPHSRAEFYQMTTDVLLNQWHHEQNRFKAREKRLVLQQLALTFQDSAARGGQDRLTMDIESVLNQVREVLPDLNLQPADASPLLDEIVERSGMLLSIDGGMRYAFAHLTLQEFFAAERLRDDPAAMIDRFKSDRDAWRETIKLWCGLVTDSTAAIRVMYAEDPIVAFECLADAQKVDQTLAGGIVEEFKNRLESAGKITAVLHAFGAVASDGRPRGVAVLEFLERTLDAASPALRMAAANAMSFTNLPQAARAIADRYLTRPEFRAPLVRMGDIAVPALLSQVISDKAADALSDLQAIGTPQASRAMAPLLWREDRQLATQAAWRLAAMLPLPDVEESLRDYALTQKQKNAEHLDWIWRPFEEPPDSALPIIAGRVASLIDQGATPDAPILLDARLVIPLCATKAGKGFDLKRLV
ncbi:MAG: NACHT domain-containing protein, partial [Blastocatellia bacterium]